MEPLTMVLSSISLLIFESSHFVTRIKDPIFMIANPQAAIVSSLAPILSLSLIRSKLSSFNPVLKLNSVAWLLSYRDCLAQISFI